tara:strand:+ start:1241 stop:1525 length:285 start_codon:yes stop_codon:yes gene_type:complete
MPAKTINERIGNVILWVTGTLVSYVEQEIIPEDSIKLTLSRKAKKDFLKLLKAGFEPEWSEIMICLETFEDDGLIDTIIYSDVLDSLPSQYGIA